LYFLELAEIYVRFCFWDDLLRNVGAMLVAMLSRGHVEPRSPYFLRAMCYLNMLSDC